MQADPDPRRTGLEAGASQDGGFAMVAVLVILLVVAAPVARFGMTARSDLTDASSALRQDQLRYLANGLLAARLHDLGAGRDDVSLLSAERRRSHSGRCRSGDLDIDVIVQDQAGLVDLNAADARLVASGLAALGIAPADARALAGAIAPGRDGAGDDAGSGETAPEPPPPEEFEAVEALHNMPGLRAIDISALRSVFTVHSRSAALLQTEIPRGLEAALPFPRSDYLATEASPEKTWRVEIAVRDRRDTVGFAGAVAATQAGQGPVILERYRVTPSPWSAGGAAGPCSTLFGDAVAAWLGRAS